MLLFFNSHPTATGEVGATLPVGTTAYGCNPFSAIPEAGKGFAR